MVSKKVSKVSGVDQSRVAELEAAWERLKELLGKEPADKQMHALYDSMREAIKALKSEQPSQLKRKEGAEK